MHEDFYYLGTPRSQQVQQGTGLSTKGQLCHPSGPWPRYTFCSCLYWHHWEAAGLSQYTPPSFPKPMLLLGEAYFKLSVDRKAENVNFGPPTTYPLCRFGQIPQSPFTPVSSCV